MSAAPARPSDASPGCCSPCSRATTPATSSTPAWRRAPGASRLSPRRSGCSSAPSGGRWRGPPRARDRRRPPCSARRPPPGFLAVHLLPFALAPFAELRPSAVSWALAWAPTAVGLLLAGVAWREHAGCASRGAATTAA